MVNAHKTSCECGSIPQPSTIFLRPVSDDDFAFIFDLYSERSESAKISQEDVSRKASDNFNASRPYKEDFIVCVPGGEPIGRVILDYDGSVGIDIVKKHWRRGYGRHAVKKLMDLTGRKTFYANINPKNTDSINFFKSIGFKPHKLVLKGEVE